MLKTMTLTLTMTMTRDANLNSNILLRLFHSLPFRLPIANNVDDDAVAFFTLILNKRHPPSEFEINKILRSIVNMKQYPTAVSLFAQMEFRGITPSLVALSILINCFCYLGHMDSALSRWVINWMS